VCGRQPLEGALRGACDSGAVYRVAGRGGVVDDVDIQTGLADDGEAARPLLRVIERAIDDDEIVDSGPARGAAHGINRADDREGNAQGSEEAGQREHEVGVALQQRGTHGCCPPSRLL